MTPRFKLHAAVHQGRALHTQRQRVFLVFARNKHDLAPKAQQGSSQANPINMALREQTLVDPGTLMHSDLQTSRPKKEWCSSFRIMLACGAWKAGHGPSAIQALCRWQTEDSLRVYARLNPTNYQQLLSRAAASDVASVSVASLPPLSSELAVRQLLGLSLVDALAAT